MILFLTNLQEDAHAARVGAELRRRGEEVRIFDPGTFPGTALLTVEGTGGGVSTAISADDGSLDLAKVKSVWLRRPQAFRLQAALFPEEERWLRTECDHLVQAVWASMGALWVSPPQAIQHASLKLLQLRVAAELGFRLPRYIVTNAVDRAAAFLAAHPAGVVVKALARPTILRQDRATMLYTHLVTPEDREHLEAVRHGPTFLQEFIPKALDVRVTVIGGSLFAAGIESGGEEAARIDFRQVEAFDLPHRCLVLPEPVRTACLALVRRLDLQFGAIDLLLTPDGEYVFLEINPNGQWLWIEMITGMPLTAAMCDLLALRAEG